MKTMSNIITSRKFVWPAGIILAGLYFSPNIIRALHHEGSQPSVVVPSLRSKPSPAVPPATAPTVAAPLTSTGALPDAPVQYPAATLASAGAPTEPNIDKFVGTWNGFVALPRGNCTLSVTVSASHGTPHPANAFSTLSCTQTPLEMLANAKKQTIAESLVVAANKMNPTSAILAGDLQQDGSLKFDTTKNIGVTEVSKACSISAMTLTPFAAQMAVEWKESQQGDCQGGQMILSRGPR
jgi:hypothetical protein